MRMLLKASFDTEKGNEAIRNGTLGKLIQEAVEQMKPEATYFCAEDGRRTAFIYFDMKDSSEIPVYAEHFFLNLDAKISYQPVMNLEDVEKGLSQFGR